MATIPESLENVRAPALSTDAGRAWRATLVALALFTAWLGLWFWDTAASMVSIWSRSETFAHGFLVVPISAWLAWRQRRTLAALRPAPVLWPGVLVLAAAVAAWLAGEVTDVLAARHFALVLMFVSGVWMLTGHDVTRRLAFPLFFLFFAVPVGEFLIPTLIDWTANVTIAALRASGVPVWREGMTFQIPTGSWSIVAACAGLRYLIASVTVGVLYAYLSYRSLPRRLAFVLASIIVPIIANWMRAYMIVMIGHLSNNKLAVGVDHVIYGWIFFGVVMLLLFWVGSFWREDHGAQAAPAAASPLAPPSRRGVFTQRLAGALGAVLAVSVLAPLALARLQSQDFQGTVATTPPQLGDWQPTSGTLVGWTPEFTPPRAAIASTYARDAARAGLYVALYYNQDPSSKLVSSSNQLLRTSDRNGYVVSQRSRSIDVGGRPFAVEESILRIGTRRVAARNWFVVDGEATASVVRAKLLQARARLAGRGDAGAIVVAYALLSEDSDATPPALDDLTRAAVQGLPRIVTERLGGDAR